MISHTCLLLLLFEIFTGKIIMIVLFLNSPCYTGIIMVSVHCSVVCQNRNGCSGNGECVLGVCQCDTGHTGTRCETSEYYK